MQNDLTAHLTSLEEQRCAAASNGDLDALKELVSKDVTHTHISGKTQNFDEYFEGLGSRPRRTDRNDDLTIRFYGDTAVMTGTIRNTFPAAEPGALGRVVNIQALQVWVNEGDAWRQVAYAASAQRPD